LKKYIYIYIYINKFLIEFYKTFKIKKYKIQKFKFKFKFKLDNYLLKLFVT